MFLQVILPNASSVGANTVKEFKLKHYYGRQLFLAATKVLNEPLLTAVSVHNISVLIKGSLLLP
jgi:hypothetical protein